MDANFVTVVLSVLFGGALVLAGYATRETARVARSAVSDSARSVAETTEVARIAVTEASNSLAEAQELIRTQSQLIASSDAMTYQALRVMDSAPASYDGSETHISEEQVDDGSGIDNEPEDFDDPLISGLFRESV